MGQEYDRHFEDFRSGDPSVNSKEKGGLLYLNGSFLLDHEDEIINLVNHESHLAETRNPGHKVTNISKADGRITVKISDHNLALHIGKRLEHAYKGQHKFQFATGEKFVEVHWERND
ncbi:hypothetical protein A2311_01680 [candidate division WOR-1 bacterium RIFOXYB2_FULL_48_7]|uniref:Uncharacterized protein n=1 Tax=candidate division WOR-1 bacterium RIFOXYB2_FULL_48_7 TaxID=1802583 RepID=A0A1F4TS99_UNCSA|nr:MAG: hypothetical protein A2311_01680 [candidate division WOR-1 bacterium RIFOXYB2_FULL_48_7]